MSHISHTISATEDLDHIHRRKHLSLLIVCFWSLLEFRSGNIGFTAPIHIIRPSFLKNVCAVCFMQYGTMMCTQVSLSVKQFVNLVKQFVNLVYIYSTLVL